MEVTSVEFRASYLPIIGLERPH